jgi:integrase
MPRTDRTGEQMPDEVNAEMLKSYESHLRKTLPTRHRQNGEARDRQGSIVAKFRTLQILFSHFNLFICERPRALDGRGILKRQDMPKINTAKKLREAKAKQTQTVIIYSDEEIKAMLEAATVDEADLIKFLLETGVRDKEAAHCEWNDIDGNHLLIRDKLSKYGWQAKDKEIRSVPLRPALVTRLKARKLRQEKQAAKNGQDAPTLIFPNKYGRPNLALDNTVQRVVERAKENGFKWNPKSEVTMHKFRKNYATLMHRAGATVVTIRDLLGHSDEATTQLYIAPEPQRAAEVSKIAFEAFGD